MFISAPFLPLTGLVVDIVSFEGTVYFFSCCTLPLPVVCVLCLSQWRIPWLKDCIITSSVSESILFCLTLATTTIAVSFLFCWRKTIPINVFPGLKNPFLPCIHADLYLAMKVFILFHLRLSPSVIFTPVFRYLKLYTAISVLSLNQGLCSGGSNVTKC